MWKIIAIAAVGLFVPCLHAEPELKGSPGELAAYLASVPKTVSLTGEAEVKVPADRALISLNVVTENKSLQEASRANQEIRARILRALTEQGLPAERIKASKFSSTPKYGVFKEKAKSYRVENAIKITAHDEKEFQAVAGVVDNVSEVRYESVEFENSEKNELKLKACAQALEKAMERKKLYEENLGVKLTAKGFYEAVAVPNRSGRTLNRAVGIDARYASVSPSFSGPVPAQDALLTSGLANMEEIPASFSELVYTARVAVEYAVESK